MGWARWKLLSGSGPSNSLYNKSIEVKPVVKLNETKEHIVRDWDAPTLSNSQVEEVFHLWINFDSNPVSFGGLDCQ